MSIFLFQTVFVSVMQSYVNFVAKPLKIPFEN